MATVGTVWESAADTWTSHAVMLLPTLAVSGVIEHIELDKGLDMVDKAGVGEKKWISQKWLSNETNNNNDKKSDMVKSVGKYKVISYSQQSVYWMFNGHWNWKRNQINCRRYLAYGWPSPGAHF